jgi:hypothetical protein
MTPMALAHYRSIEFLSRSFRAPKYAPLWMAQFAYYISILCELELLGGGNKLSDGSGHWLSENVKWFEWPDERARDRIRQREWSKAVIKRDDGTCGVCGSRSNIEAHHLSNSSAFPSIRFVINNGVTLCRSCHTEFHSWLGGYKVPCIEADYLAFKASHASRKPRKVTNVTSKLSSRWDVFRRF